MRTARFSLIPDFKFKNLCDIPPEFLREHGILFLMLDIDNTIASYREHAPSETVLQWFGRLREAGVKPFLVSNSKKTGRVETFAKALGAGYIMNARKPSPVKLHRAMGMAGFDAGSSGFAGDQIITDMLAANRAGVVSIIVSPIRLSNPFFVIRYLMELPFRWCVKIQKKGI